jgi:hypothetical protein
MWPVLRGVLNPRVRQALFFPFIEKKYIFSLLLFTFQKETGDIPHTSGGADPPRGWGGGWGGVAPHRAGGGCNPPTGTRSQVRYVACSERGSGPPSPTGFSFFLLSKRNIFFLSLLFTFKKRVETYHIPQGGATPPRGWGLRGRNPACQPFLTAQTSWQQTGRPRWSRLR